MTTTYRPDIDGLRAAAVVPVVLFHSKISLFGSQLFPGGFVGVDIFFVISGYLISNILLNDISRNQFSILKFYERRVRRIFPALFAMLIFAVCVALVILLPGAGGEMNDFGKRLFAATFFYSNYQFMSETGYFAPAAENNPLLHLWSLAVEEQFYVVFPLYLYLISHFSRDRLGLATIAVFVVSLIYSIWLIHADAIDAFYSSPARAWELMLGAMIAIFPRTVPIDQRAAQMLSATGAAFILFAILFYSEGTPFPGAAALLPCIGAALVIYAGQHNVTAAGRLLSTKAFRYPGLISYSLYLWHWPVLVFYRLYAINPLTLKETFMLLAVMTSAAWASWKYVEAPFRNRTALANRKPLFATAAGVMLVSAGFGMIIVLYDGFPVRLPEQAKHYLTAAQDLPKIEGCEIAPDNKDIGVRVCPIGAPRTEKATFAVWGDSHGIMLAPGISAAAQRAGVRGILFQKRAGCPPMLGIDRHHQGYDGCPNSAATTMAYLKAHPEITTIFLVARWAIYVTTENEKVYHRPFVQTLAQLASLNRQIIVVTSIPVYKWSIPAVSARASIFNRDTELRQSIKDYTDQHAFVTAVFNENRDRYGLSFIRPHEAMCDAEFCEVFDDGKPVYYDHNHITRTYALKLSYLFDPLLQAMAAGKKSSQQNTGN